MEPLGVYLAGNLHTEWRSRLKSMLVGVSIEFLEPKQGGTPSQFTPRDLVLIRRCDMLLAFLEEWDHSEACRHIGTSAEIGYAHALGKPIILVNAWNQRIGSFEFLEAMAVSVVKYPTRSGVEEFRTDGLLMDAASILKFIVS